MSDLISRQAAIDAMEGLPKYFDKTDTLCLDYADVLAVLSEHLPSAEPERMKGKWIDETFKPWGLVHHPYRCDQCGDHADSTYDYCPSCGAKMEAE